MIQYLTSDEELNCEVLSVICYDDKFYVICYDDKFYEIAKLGNNYLPSESFFWTLLPLLLAVSISIPN